MSHTNYDTRVAVFSAARSIKTRCEITYRRSYLSSHSKRLLNDCCGRAAGARGSSRGFRDALANVMGTWVVPDTLPAAIDDDETIAIVSGAKVGVVERER